jgi:hypothetical protein
MREHYYAYIGDKGAMSLSVTEIRNEKSRDILYAEVHFHQSEPAYESDIMGNCGLLPEGKCYCGARVIDYDLSKQLVDGDKNINEFLKEEYRKKFGG